MRETICLFNQCHHTKVISCKILKIGDWQLTRYTEGLIVSQLHTHSRVHLIVAVKEALVLLPNFLFGSNCELSGFLEACVR